MFETHIRQLPYGAKYPEISRISCVSAFANASMEPLLTLLGTIAMFDVTNPSRAFSVETTGCCWPAGHNVRKPRGPLAGTTVALKTYALALLGGWHGLPTTLIVRSPWNG